MLLCSTVFGKGERNAAHDSIKSERQLYRNPTSASSVWATIKDKRKSICKQYIKLQKPNSYKGIKVVFDILTAEGWFLSTHNII